MHILHQFCEISAAVDMEDGLDSLAAALLLQTWLSSQSKET